MGDWVYVDHLTFKKRFFEDLEAQAGEDNNSANLMVKTAGPFKVLTVHSHPVTFEENGIVITVSQDRISVSPTVVREE